jgi:hypothetical protein
MGASFEVVDPPPEISLLSLSLACGWPPGANGSLPSEWRRLQGFRVEYPSGARKGGPNRPPKWAGPAVLGRPAKAHFGRPFAPVGAQVIMHFAPSTCMILTMSSSRPRWRFSAHEVRFSTTSNLFSSIICTTSEVVQIIELKRFRGAPNGYPFAPLRK